MTTVRFLLKRFTNANSTRTRYNIGLLRNKDTQATFQISLSNRFQSLQVLTEDDETDIETQWKHCKKLRHDTCEEVLGKRKTQHKEWISADTIHRQASERQEREPTDNNQGTAETMGWTLHRTSQPPTPDSPPDIPPTETELPISCDKPPKAEIKQAIMTLRSGKAAEPDEIPAEAIKADIETAVNMLYSLFSKIWEKEAIPAQWKEGNRHQTAKKGDLRDYSNYRWIMALSAPGKVLNRVLLERMKEAVDPKLQDQQAGFLRGGKKTLC